jgi:hypothetical protein
MGRKKSDKNYFTLETEAKIIEYNNTKDSEVRSQIYKDHIHYPFFKLTQNIIHRYKFYNTEVDNIEHLQHEVITFLLSKIHLFDESKGTKAYSYFGTITKNYLIQYNRKNYNKKITHVDTSVIQSNTNYSYVMDNEELDLHDYIDAFTVYATDNLYKLFDDEYSIKIADAILEIFRKRGFIQNFNKKALYIFVKEIVDVPTTHITPVVRVLKKVFYSGLENYIQFKEISFELENS